jgi:GNAT superfamily N-acetyltransferase
MNNYREKSVINIRLAQKGDIPMLVNLSDQLGYLISDAIVRRNLEIISDDRNQKIYVAELTGIGVVGWVHVFITRRIEDEPFSEIGGLIVDEGWRRKGIGKQLMKKAEEWSVSKGVSLLRVRSNAIRKEAHQFYEKSGYIHEKDQCIFIKSLTTGMDETHFSQ